MKKHLRYVARVNHARHAHAMPLLFLTHVMRAGMFYRCLSRPIPTRRRGATRLRCIPGSTTTCDRSPSTSRPQAGPFPLLTGPPF
jgi:hypothetical protein